MGWTENGDFVRCCATGLGGVATVEKRRSTMRSRLGERDDAKGASLGQVVVVKN